MLCALAQRKCHSDPPTRTVTANKLTCVSHNTLPASTEPDLDKLMSIQRFQRTQPEGWVPVTSGLVFCGWVRPSLGLSSSLLVAGPPASSAASSASMLVHYKTYQPLSTEKIKFFIIGS